MRLKFLKKVAKMGDRFIITIPPEYHKFLDKKITYLIEIGTIGGLLCQS